MRLFRLTILTLLLPLASRAQKPEELTEHTSSQGEKFLAVPGASALFAIHETTVSQWQAFVDATQHEWTYKPHFNQGPDHPVVGVTLQDAKLFCAWLTDHERASKHINVAQSYRLPTQAEWDAAVGLLKRRKTDLTVDDQVQDGRTYPWGTRWPPPAKAGNYAEAEIPGYEDGFPFTAPVGQFAPNTEGLYDLAGNVWEWCWDGEVRAEQEGLLRGGSWAYFRAECLTSAYIYRVPADLRMPTIGFRCVFEDKQRSAAILAMAESEREKIRAERRDQIMGGPVDKSEMEAMKKKLLGNDSGSNLPDVSKLKPAAAGSPFENSLGMAFAPVGDRLLAGTTEVRVQDFETWLKSTERNWENKPSFLLGGTHPAAGLSWSDAHDFCDWLTKRDQNNQLIPSAARYRLPTDLEWSLLAGLKDETGADPAQRHQNAPAHYPWSSRGEFPPPAMSANLDATHLTGFTDSYSYTAPVSTEPANDLGLSGLGGNVAEWCADGWPGAEAERVIRGGSWLGYDKDQLRTGHRRHAPLNQSSPDVGFRVMLELPAP